jgi:hypothetical protein
MSTASSIIVLFNFLWLAYLTYIIYKKNKDKLTKTDNILSQQQGNKINLIRFNPFDDLGGNQSFILVMLDNTNSGVIITSLHSRDVTRIYAKSIKNGEGENTSLSKEEKMAVAKTINNY